MNGGRTGIPEVDALIAAADHERDQYWALAAVSDAEGTVAAVRGSELVAQQKAASRRWSAAKGRLTRAQKDGDATKIAAARARYDAAYTELDAISAKVITELHGIAAAGLDRTGRQLDQMKRSADAGDAVLDALRKRPS